MHYFNTRVHLHRIIAQIPAAVAILVAWLWLGVAQAQSFQYQVQLEVDSNVRSLLEKNLQLQRWQGSENMDAEQFLRLYRTAPDQIKELLATEGYFQPKITPSLQRDTSPWQAKFVIELGDPVLVAGVDLRIVGFGAGPEGGTSYAAPELLPAWNLPQGALFRQEQWEAAKRALLRQLNLMKYPRAQIIESQATVDVANGQAQLLVVVDRGPAVTFGSLRVEGLQRYPAAVVDNLVQIRRGDLYTEQALLDLQQRLQDSNYFSNVVVSAEFSEEIDALTDQAEVPLLVRVTEYKRKKVDAGIGFSTNTGKRVQLVLDDLAFMGTQARAELMLETKKQNIGVNFALPASKEGYHDRVGTSTTRSEIEGEITVQTTLGVRRRWGEQKLTRDFSLEYLTERKTLEGATTQNTRGLPVNYEVTWRNLDNLMLPRQGYLLQAKVGGALPLLGGHTFVRFSTRGLYYLPLGKQDLLLGRAELGVLASKDTEQVPSTYLFRAGGDQSVRGYAYQQLGVREGDAITGGRYLASVSAEYQHWFGGNWGNWGAATFIDGGNAANQVHQLHPAWGYGVGARWKSPVGPINIDLAYGRNVRKTRLHFSLGLAF